MTICCIPKPVCFLVLSFIATLIFMIFVATNEDLYSSDCTKYITWGCDNAVWIEEHQLKNYQKIVDMLASKAVYNLTGANRNIIIWTISMLLGVLAGGFIYIGTILKCIFKRGARRMLSV